MRARSAWWPLAGGLIGGAIAGAIAWSLAGNDVGHAGDWRGGALRFIGMVTALGAFVGFFTATRLTRGPAVTRSGFTLSYKTIAPKADGYRELQTLAVSELVARLSAVGYEPRIEACDELGQRRGSIDTSTPLAGINVAVSDPAVRGWVRVQLAAMTPDQPRALGLVEIWSERGDSAEELGLFAVRALDDLLGGLAAARDTSRLGEDPASLLTAGLADRPVHRG